MWAPAPEPGSHASSHADATGAGANYVYLVDAADDRGNVRELQLIFFGRESDGEGWLEIEARGRARGSGPLIAAQVQFRRGFQEVEHGEDTGGG